MRSLSLWQRTKLLGNERKSCHTLRAGTLWQRTKLLGNEPKQCCLLPAPVPSQGYKSAELGVFFARIKDPWLEDNFSGDHGINPFPHRTAGPDLLNKNESVWTFKIKQDWSRYLLQGLQSNVGYATGHGAENSISRKLGRASEDWFNVDLRYVPVFLQDLKVRLRYRDYQSSKRGVVNGVKGDRSEVRFYVDYSYRF